MSRWRGLREDRREVEGLMMVLMSTLATERRHLPNDQIPCMPQSPWEGACSRKGSYRLRIFGA
jgi:hypothetical protein